MRAPRTENRRRWRDAARGCAGAVAAMALTFAGPAAAQDTGDAMRTDDKPCPTATAQDPQHYGDKDKDEAARAERTAATDRQDLDRQGFAADDRESRTSADRDERADRQRAMTDERQDDYEADRERSMTAEKKAEHETDRELADTDMRDSDRGLADTGTRDSDRELADADVRDAVERQLRNARGVDANDVDVEISDGVVTLTGTVDNVIAEERAERLAGMVKGVSDVRNELRVEGERRTSAELTAAVQQALRSDPATDAWQIQANAQDGLVILTGTVDDQREKRLAEEVVQGVRGVEEIDNQLEVRTTADRRSATEIEDEIENALMWDARVDDAMVDVAVDAGTVTLTGTVGSAYERQLAIADAWTEGVREVDASGLDVQWDARDEMRGSERFADRGDADVRRAVDAALEREPRLSELDADVTVDAGVVTLSGVVDNTKAKRAAAQAAADVQGVRRVENHLKVRPSQEMDDSAIAGNIRTALENDPYVEQFAIDVAVRDGIARLTGEVDSYFDMWQAGDAAASVNGVRQVNNRLHVGYQPADYDAWFYDWDPLGNDFDHTYDTPRATNFTDSEIREEIDDELFWSPFVDADEVNVTVNDGVATLTGTVDTWSERRAATEQAVEGGALTVDNQLDVQWQQDRVM